MFALPVLRTFSTPHEELLLYSIMTAVVDALSIKCVVQEKSKGSGTSVEAFMELLLFYLNSTFVMWRGKAYVQKAGVCIGSRLAPTLSDIFLAKVNRDLEPALKDVVQHAPRYVDDYLVFISNFGSSERIKKVLEEFSNLGKGLKFMHEVPNNDKLQFLDISIKFCDGHVCWCYNPRSVKPILHFNSGHSKNVKRGLATSCICAAVSKSCVHLMLQSFSSQFERLKQAGFPEAIYLFIYLQVYCGLSGRPSRCENLTKVLAYMNYQVRAKHGESM